VRQYAVRDSRTSNKLICVNRTQTLSLISIKEKIRRRLRDPLFTFDRPAALTATGCDEQMFGEEKQVLLRGSRD